MDIVGTTRSNKALAGKQGLVYCGHSILSLTIGSGTVSYMVGGIHELIEVASGDMVNLDLPTLVLRSALALVRLWRSITVTLGFFAQNKRTNTDSPDNPRDVSPFGQL